VLDDSLHNEKQLFALIAEGDEKAFKTLYYQFLPRLQPLISAIIRSDDHVKDLVQEVFLRIWLNRKDLPDIRDPKAWIFQITYFQSYSWLRRLAVRKKAAGKLYAEQDSLGHNNPVTDYITVQEIGRLVRESISALSPQAQRIYRLSREEHLKIPEIAARLGISPNTVKNTLVRSLKKISESLKEKGVFLPGLLLVYYLA
jgi:RNA polymerase sigma-70 factor (ECF subfamily)